MLFRSQKAFSLYGVKSSLILVDTIGTIADIVGDALSDRTFVVLYFPNLMEKFVELEVRTCLHKT